MLVMENSDIIEDTVRVAVQLFGLVAIDVPLKPIEKMKSTTKLSLYQYDRYLLLMFTFFHLLASRIPAIC